MHDGISKNRLQIASRESPCTCKGRRVSLQKWKRRIVEHLCIHEDVNSPSCIPLSNRPSSASNSLGCDQQRFNSHLSYILMQFHANTLLARARILLYARPVHRLSSVSRRSSHSQSRRVYGTIGQRAGHRYLHGSSI